MENEEASQKSDTEGVIELPGVVSRKKQLVPMIVLALQE